MDNDFKQVTVDDFLSRLDREERAKEKIKKLEERECRNCKYWELLPIAEYREGWGIKGFCPEMHRLSKGEYSETNYLSMCDCYEDYEEEPKWIEQLRRAETYGRAITLKTILLEWNIDLWNHRIFDKNGNRLKEYENTFGR